MTDESNSMDLSDELIKDILKDNNEDTFEDIPDMLNGDTEDIMSVNILPIQDNLPILPLLNDFKKMNAEEYNHLKEIVNYFKSKKELEEYNYLMYIVKYFRITEMPEFAPLKDHLTYGNKIMTLQNLFKKFKKNNKKMKVT